MAKINKPIVIVLLVTTTVLYNSCRKNVATPFNETGTTYNISSEQEKVLSFLERYEQYQKQPDKSEGDSVSLSQAVWYWDAAFNYQYGFPETYIENIQQDTFYLKRSDVNFNGFITENNLLQIYSEIIETARDRYVAIDLENKSLKYVIVQSVSGSKSGNDYEIEIILTIGEAKIPQTITPQSIYGQPYASTGNRWPWGKIRKDGIDTSDYATIALTNAIDGAVCDTKKMVILH